MVVYVEIVLLENLLIDGLLLWLTLQALKLKTNWWGLFASSIFGALFALFSPIINLSGFWAILVKIFVSFVMSVMLCFNFKKILLKNVLFLIFTFAFGGSLIALLGFLGISTSNGLAVGYNFKIPLGAVFAGLIIFAITITKFFCAFYKKKKLAQFYFDVGIEINKKTSKLKGFLDTGNTLSNRQGKPIILLSSNLLSRWFDVSQEMKILLEKYSDLGLLNIQKKVVESISGKQTIFVFDGKCLIEKKELDVAIGICKDNKFFNKGFDVILNPRLLEV